MAAFEISSVFVSAQKGLRRGVGEFRVEPGFDSVIGGGMGVPEAVALEIPAVEEGSPTPLARVPPRIRRRLLQAGSGENGGKAPTAEEIETKLRQAHLRRQVCLCSPFPLA